MLSRLPDIARLWLWCIALFALTLWLGTRHNDFPWYYHPDEPGKVEQVLGSRPLNFHHPMLMLNAAKAAVSIAGIPQEPQAVVQAGRWVSAAFAAGAVVALSLLGFVQCGWRVALLSGLALATHHQIYELSHYMKEDTALLFGLAVTFLAAHLHEKKPGNKTSLLVGMGVGLAISGKMLGAMALIIAVPVFYSNRKKTGWKPIVAAAICAVVVIAATNPQALANLSAVRASSAREIDLATGGQGMTQSVPHGKYWSIFLANTTPVMWPLILALLMLAWRRRLEVSVASWITLGFPFALGIGLSFFPKENDRYFLPATALFTLLAAAAVPELARLLPGRRALLMSVLGVALIAGQIPSWTDDRGGLWRYEEAFQNDDTADLATWLKANTSPSDIIAKDNRVRLPDGKRSTPNMRPLPNKILSDDYVADIGTLDKLQAMGVKYVIISESTYMRFERSGLRPKAGGAGDAERRRSFYADLRRSYEPAWARARDTVIYLHPGIEVYRIAQ